MIGFVERSTVFVHETRGTRVRVTTGSTPIVYEAEYYMRKELGDEDDPLPRRFAGEQSLATVKIQCEFPNMRSRKAARKILENIGVPCTEGKEEGRPYTLSIGNVLNASLAPPPVGFITSFSDIKPLAAVLKALYAMENEGLIKAKTGDRVYSILWDKILESERKDSPTGELFGAKKKEMGDLFTAARIAGEGKPGKAAEFLNARRSNGKPPVPVVQS